MKEQNDKLYRQYQEQDFVPQGTSSAVNTSIEKLQGELVDVQSKRIALDAACFPVAADDIARLLDVSRIGGRVRLEIIREHRILTATVIPSERVE